MPQPVIERPPVSLNQLDLFGFFPPSEPKIEPILHVQERTMVGSSITRHSKPLPDRAETEQSVKLTHPEPVLPLSDNFYVQHAIDAGLWNDRTALEEYKVDLQLQVRDLMARHDAHGPLNPEEQSELRNACREIARRIVVLADPY